MPADAPAPPPASPRFVLPHVPALVAGLRGAVLLDTDGEFHRLTIAEAAKAARDGAPLVCHGPAVAGRLGLDHFPCLDILELFAFVRPARFCLPTPRGVMEAVGLAQPADAEDEAEGLFRAARRLLEELAAVTAADNAAKAADTRSIAWAMARAGWSWGTAVLAALGVQGDAGRNNGLRVWERLPEWSEHAPEAPPGNAPVEPEEARLRLRAILGDNSEQRPAQADYASAAAAAFLPRDRAGEPRVVLAEAGTGTGKTLGYIAPASLWAEKNGAPVWISTHTRNLQRQLDGELDRLFPNPLEKAQRVVVRKGRENYVCLLNYEEQMMRNRAAEALSTGLMARWLLATRDGDMVGGDFPGWLVDVAGRPGTLGMADRRGECIFSGCPHFNKCFIEKAVRRARRADIVVANHALVMVQAAMGGLDDSTQPTRLVFDEGHHVFEAADGAFSAHLSGFEATEVRRWLLGPEGDGGRSRARGLKRRAEDLAGQTEGGAAALEAALLAAQVLPGPGWQNRIQDNTPGNPTEAFLCLVRQQVYARAQGGEASPYSLETECRPLVDGLAEAALELAEALGRIGAPLMQLARRLEDKMDDDAAEMDSATRARIEGLTRAIERRVLVPVGGWKSMLEQLVAGDITTGQYVDWFGVDRIDGRDIDVGMHRHWIDPTVPFAKAVVEPAHGVLVTSATLRDGAGSADWGPDGDWSAAERRTGVVHLPAPALRAAVPSPFDYPAQTRVMVVSDVRKDDMDQVAAAYRELFLAAGGGALGLFTAISRLKAVHKRIGPALDDAGLALLAQHVDNMDTSTLVDIFRAEHDSCLLGTDAVRDGVDVPGSSLRLIVFDRVPWPRPDILHKARRAAFGGKAYDDMITRLRLKQAFGRLVRRAGDHGVFVLLDPMMPTRLFSAFPGGVQVRKVGLAEAVATTRAFLAETAPSQ